MDNVEQLEEEKNKTKHEIHHWRKLKTVFDQVSIVKTYLHDSSSGVKHANTEHILEFDWPKQRGRMQWERNACKKTTNLFENLRSWGARLGVVKLEEVSRLGHRQLGLQNVGNCSTQLLVHVGVKATNWDQLTIGSRLLRPTKGDGYRTLQHNHHILYINENNIVKVLSLPNQKTKQTNN